MKNSDFLRFFILTDAICQYTVVYWVRKRKLGINPYDSERKKNEEYFS